ncbi:uncharacterized protein ASCRUDRAFT_10715 [Ascoidea rubescens DSM 1968]|uniref:Uncharacterized protein n=1 Tax=Ascoidea rubescens DSM 1968 TaxID=1344418 RepID=A0A1D2V852_9ASCO|nr:hypothetical protein ASCRUDRAFT_10715 [Ascoidea rubescens DSM 1968]ODV57851.1 hypothetical protein ASCRUDRAFT_10715 [Ascoidea rubescens DSM 1968]
MLKFNSKIESKFGLLKFELSNMKVLRYLIETKTELVVEDDFKKRNDNGNENGNVNGNANGAGGDNGNSNGNSNGGYWGYLGYNGNNNGNANGNSNEDLLKNYIFTSSNITDYSTISAISITILCQPYETKYIKNDNSNNDDVFIYTCYFYYVFIFYSISIKFYYQLNNNSNQNNSNIKNDISL